MAHEIRFGNKLIHRNQPVGILPGKFWWVLLALLSVFLMAAVLAAPGLPSFVINYEQKQCGWILGGDENVFFTPPKPWKVVQSGIIETEFGSCNIDAIYGSSASLNFEDCCKQLGYTFIGKIEGFPHERDSQGREKAPVHQIAMPSRRYILGALCIAALAVFLILKLVKYKNNFNKQETTTEQNDS